MAVVSESDWSKTLDFIRVNHRQLVRDWFDQLKPGQLVNGVLEVQLTDPRHQRYLSESCRSAFVEAAQTATGRLVTVAFTLIPGAFPEPALPELAEPELTLNESYRFEHFITGPCNRMAHAACVAVSESPGRAYNPLFIHGSAGLGKTHLLQAVCHRVMEHLHNATVLFLSCETFANHLVEAIERGGLHQFRYRYRHVDLLVIDDIQFLAERERSQEEFFHTFNTLFQSQKQLILSSDTPPREIPSLEERLVSRFNSGLVARIDPPCLDTRLAILRSKAKLKCIDLPEDVAQYIASRIDANARELEGALHQIHALSQTIAGPMTVGLAAEALTGSTALTTRPVTVPAIVDLVVDLFSVKASELHGRKRTKSIAYPRQICMYLARELTSLSLEEIGTYFGGRDHTTVLHASRTIATRRKDSPELDQTIAEMAKTLKRG